MIGSPPQLPPHVRNENTAIVYHVDDSNSRFWSEHEEILPFNSTSVFWTRERQFIDLTESTHKSKSFKTGWDGYYAPPPNDKAVRMTLNTLSKIRFGSLNPYSVLPSAEGGIGISFRGPNNKRAVLEMLNDGTISYVLYGKGYPTKSALFNFDTDWTRVLQLLTEYL